MIKITYPPGWPIVIRHLGEHHDQAHHGKRKLTNGSGKTLTTNQRGLTKDVIGKLNQNPALKRFIEKQTTFLGKHSDLSVALAEAKTVIANESASDSNLEADSGNSTAQATNHTESTPSG